MDTHKQLQEASSNAIFTSVKDTVSLGIKEMQKTIFETFTNPQSPNSSDTKNQKLTYKKGQFSDDLAKREEAVSRQRE